MKKRLLEYVPLISNKTKIFISSMLLILALVTCVFSSYSIDSKICLLAMFFSFIGDILLNCTTLEKRPHSLLYTGAIFFMISHIIYASAYYHLIRISQKAFFNVGTYTAIISLLLILAISIICLLILNQKLKPSMIFIFAIYIVMISINFITIYSYSWNFNALSFLGATSFLISDYIIGIETVFKIRKDTLRKLVWFFYPIGQILIIICR